MMNFISDFLQNRALCAAILAWLIAQALKILINLIHEKKLDLKLLVSSGGMPSSHSATVCSLSAVVFRLYGLSSTEFAIAAVLSIVVMYDAAGVRRAAGEHAKMLNKIIEDIFTADHEFREQNFKELIGHTPLQVAMGGILGIVVGALFPLT